MTASKTRVTTTVLVSTKLEVLSASVRLASSVQDVKEISTNVYPTHAQYLVLKTASNLSTTTIVTASPGTWDDTAMPKSTSAQTPPVRMEVFAQLYRVGTNASATMGSTARTANILDTLAIPTHARMEDTVEHLR